MLHFLLIYLFFSFYITCNSYNPDSCQDVLDVCCRAEDSLVVPMNNTPGVVSNRKPVGCGLRNIGGIDFTLTGNFVSIVLLLLNMYDNLHIIFIT